MNITDERLTELAEEYEQLNEKMTILNQQMEGFWRAGKNFTSLANEYRRCHVRQLDIEYIFKRIGYRVEG